MKYLTFTIIFVLLGLLHSFAQTTEKGRIQGILMDETTGETLVGVHIVIEETQTGTVTDSNGKFVIENLPKGKYTLILTFIGYAKKRIENLELAVNQTLKVGQIKLSEEAFSLNQVTVTPGSFSIMGTKIASRQTLASKDIKNMSWAEDITRAVARLPGVSSSDYSSKFTVRGGEADEVLITLDGMELYEPFHQRDYSGGLFSIVDIETIEGIELMTGGFSADYGNRLSGVFNMQTKKIKDDEKHTSVGLSVMNARVYTDGTFADNKGSYIFSARRGMLDAVFKILGETESVPTFYDAMAKVSYQLGDKHNLSAYVLQSGDKTKIRDIAEENFDKNDTKYSNTYAWLALNSYHTPHLFSRTLLYSGLVKHDRNGSFFKYEPTDKGTFTLTDKRDYSLFGVKQDWNWQISNNLLLKSGFEAKQIKADYNYFRELHEIRVNSNQELFDYDKITEIELHPSGQQIGIYLTSRFKVLPKLIAETGLRFDYTSYSNDQNVSPRISLAYAFGKNTFLRGAWGYYYQSQFINNLDVNNGITDFNTAELAKHYVLSFEHLFNNGINFRAEAYYKDLSNISPQWQNMRDHLEIFPEARNDNARIIYNGSASKGIELFLKYDKGEKISWWLSYALAKAEDDIKDIEFDGLLTKVTGKVPRLNDQRHTVYADVNYRLNKKWHFNLSWQYYKGWPRTDYTYDYKILPNGQYHFYQIHKEFNGTLYPAYHRMDLRINRHFKTPKNKNITAFLHLVNVYNRENLKKFDLDVTDDEGNLTLNNEGNYVPFEDNKYWFGFLPVIGASWAF
ncbi:MAG: TonB-dependent receptor [Chitinophagales bacterium]